MNNPEEQVEIAEEATVAEVSDSSVMLLAEEPETTTKEAPIQKSAPKAQRVMPIIPKKRGEPVQGIRPRNVPKFS